MYKALWVLQIRFTDYFMTKSISKLIFSGYTGSKNPVRNRLKIQLVQLDFSKLIFQKSSTDQQGARSLANIYTPKAKQITYKSQTNTFKNYLNP